MKRKVPWFWRRQTSCPDCGHVYERGNDENLKYGTRLDIACPRCAVVYPRDEFWKLNHDKYSNQADV